MLPVLLNIGPVSLKTYGFFVALGTLAGLYLLQKEFARMGLPKSAAEHLSAIAVGLGVLGSRLLYTFEEGLSFWEFWRIWEGGLSFIGGLFLALAGIIVYSKWNCLPFSAVSDGIVQSLALGHAIGRIGCLAAGCCWGIPSSFLGIPFTRSDSFVPAELLGVPLHPTQIYEFAGLMLIFFALRRLKYRWKGALAGFYLAFYSIMRFGLEFIRGDAIYPAVLGGLSLTQAVLAGIVFPIAILWIYIASGRLKR